MPFYQRTGNNHEEYEPTNQEIMDTIGQMLLSIEKIKNQVSKMYVELIINPKMEDLKRKRYIEDCGKVEP